LATHLRALAPIPAERPPAFMAPAMSDAEFREAPPRHLRDYLWVLQKYRWLAAICFGLTLGVTVLVILVTPRRFTASTRLQVARQSPIQLRLEDNVLRVADADQNAGGGTTFIATQVAALQSRDMAERVIRGQRLAANPAFLHPERERELFGLGGSLLNLLRPRGWQGPGATTDDDTPSGVPFDSGLVDRYMGYLSVHEVPGTDLIEVAFTTPHPALSAFLASAHTQAYLEANEEVRRGADATAKEFLSGQLRESEERVARVEAALRRFAAEHPNVAVNQEQSSIAQRISEVSSLLTKAEGVRLALQSRADFLNAGGDDLLPFFFDRPGIQKVHLALLDLRAQGAALSQRLGPGHPQMAELQRQERELAQQLQEEIRGEVQAVRSRNEAAKLREEALQRKIDHLENYAITLRDLGAHYDLLKNDVATANQLHQSLLKQQMETAVNSELAASNVRIVERSEVPARPSRPKIGLDLALGVLSGLVLALGAVFGCEYFDNSVKSSDDVQDFLQLPMLATIPNFALVRSPAALASTGNGTGKTPDGHSRIRRGGSTGRAGDGDELVVLDEPWSRVAEAFRSMRTAVLFSVRGEPPRLIVVTSSLMAEGKTVGSLNLAATLAEAGARAVLVDADLRHPRCHRALGVSNDRGLTTVLTGEAAIEDVVQPLRAARLFFVPAGPVPLNPAELIGSIRMRAALMALRSEYDVVIIDSPPVLPVNDAVVLAREADGTLLVVKGHDTPRELVRQARDRLVLAGANILGVVVNNVGLGWNDFHFYNPYYPFRAQPPAEQIA